MPLYAVQPEPGSSSTRQPPCACGTPQSHPAPLHRPPRPLRRPRRRPAPHRPGRPTGSAPRRAAPWKGAAKAARAAAFRPRGARVLARMHACVATLGAACRQAPATWRPCAGNGGPELPEPAARGPPHRIQGLVPIRIPYWIRAAACVGRRTSSASGAPASAGRAGGAAARAAARRRRKRSRGCPSYSTLFQPSSPCLPGVCRRLQWMLNALAVANLRPARAHARRSESALPRSLADAERAAAYKPPPCARTPRARPLHIKAGRKRR